MTTQQEALTPITCTTQSDDYSNANTAVNQVSGRVLLIIRVLWISVAVVTIALFAVAIPLRYKQYGEICVQQGCNWWHLSPHTLESLHMMGVSLARYKLYSNLLESFTSAIFVGIALLIFWRKSTEWIALLVSLWLVTFGTTDLLLAVQEQHPIWNHTANFLDVLGWVFLLPLFLFLFPDGRFVPRWTRWLLVGVLGLMAFLAFFVPQQVNSTTSNLTPAMFL